MDLRWPPAIRMGVWERAASIYVSKAAQRRPTGDDSDGAQGYTERGWHVVTAAPRPHLFGVGDDLATQEPVHGWPVGPALLEMLGDLNPDVREALGAERAWLTHHGYPEDFPLPGLWWAPELAPSK